MTTVLFKPDFIDLNPFLTKESIEIHFHYHHMQYYRNLISWIEEPIEDLLYLFNKYPEEKIRNNILQVMNHNLFWRSISKSMPDHQIQSLLNDINFHNRFREAANSVFGSGWTWLTYDNKNGFEIFSTSNAIAPLDKLPLLVLDLWEHAYYLSHIWNRKEYIEKFFEVLNLQFIRNQLEKNGFNISRYCENIN